jgi:hypothetical protein
MVKMPRLRRRAAASGDADAGDEVRERSEFGVISFGLALGITLALLTFVVGITAGLFGWGVVLVQVLSNLFLGYEPSFVGAIVGAVWAFVDGLIAGVIFAWLYNRFVGRHR